MAKLLGTMEAGVQQQSSGQSELNATLKTMEAMSMGDLNVSLGNTDEMSESDISQEVEDLSENIDQLLAETPQKKKEIRTKLLSRTMISWLKSPEDLLRIQM